MVITAQYLCGVMMQHALNSVHVRNGGSRQLSLLHNLPMDMVGDFIGGGGWPAKGLGLLQDRCRL